MRCWRSTQDALLHMTATNMEVTLRQDVPLLAYEGGDTTFAIDAKLLSPCSPIFREYGGVLQGRQGYAGTIQ